MAKVKTNYLCQECGYISPRYLGRCPNCNSWNTFVEQVEKPDTTSNSTASPRVNLRGTQVQPQLLDTVTTQKVPRVTTGMQELDRVLGGGIVPGSLILIGGDPGIGKSTLLLQVSGQLAYSQKKVLYVTGEESASQVKMRADRLGVGGNSFYIYPETDMASVKESIATTQPDFVVIDSVQTMQEPGMNSAVGSVAQIREVTGDLMQIAKTNGITVFVVGHVTKGGAIAGPKILEHMVDTVLYFEGDQHRVFRMIRAVKNRFGSTNEVGVFEMREQGLAEVTNPSEVFLQERLADATGSAVVVSLEGTRPLLAEIQALVTPTAFGNAQRTTTGLNRNRVALIMAVLEKRAGLLLQNQDAYLKTAGGLKLDEPAIDLALAISIASSYRDIATLPTDCFIGEIGLTGEVRRVSQIEQRVNEAVKLGFRRVFVPQNNLDGWQFPDGIQVIGVKTVEQALKLAFK
ncbi:DNA repair protein RadA [Ligilactobacillus saerimneri]|uniref:DNA repair protein RadA n=1 Tax=Ligilactobacillus saerimneri TaxID=228229 RepID=A0A7H9EJB3_9LACO|nr:DNA repair protein RadA [Ligilactobacillus saerimneri]QLL77427.1 DNA repair protein RadA [Ligilactobacillus saerimneri]